MRHSMRVKQVEIHTKKFTEASEFMDLPWYAHAERGIVRLRASVWRPFRAFFCYVPPPYRYCMGILQIELRFVR